MFRPEIDSCVFDGRASSSTEGGANGPLFQRGLVRPARTNMQSAKRSEIVRASRARSSQGLQTLITPPAATTVVADPTAEFSERNSSHLKGGSALKPLTVRQREALVAIERWVDARGWPPSLAELGRELRASSKNTVAGYLGGLARKGYIRRDAGERRGLQVLVRSKDAVVEAPKLAPLRKVHLCDRCKREVG